MLLEFINLRAQASEASFSDHKRASQVEDHSVKKGSNAEKSITSLTASTVNSTSHNCVICKSYKHPLYACLQFKSLPHDEVVSTLMLTFRTKNGWTALMKVSENGDTNVVKLLLKGHANINIWNVDGWTAFTHSSSKWS